MDDMKDFISEEFVKQRIHVQHVLKVFTLDELARSCQALLFDLSTKFVFLQNYAGKNLTTDVVTEIRHEVDVMAYGKDMALVRISFDENCRR